MSSLAAALAALKQNQYIKTTETKDAKAESSLEANSNIHLKSQHSSRLSSLQQYNLRNIEEGQLEGKLKKQQIHYDNRAEKEHEKSLPTHSKATSARRRRGTKKGTNDDIRSSLLATANDHVPKSSETVFLCDVPSDSDDNDDGRLVKSKNSRRKKRGGENKGIIEDGHGEIAAAATTGVGEMVFVCDIPSSCGAVNNDRRNNNNSRHHHDFHGNRDLGNGGQRRSDRDNPLNNTGRSVSRGGRGNDQRHSNTSQDHAAKHRDNNSGIKPTPWSARAPDNDTGNNCSSRAECWKSNISSSSSRVNNNQGFHKQYTPVNDVPTRCTDTSNQTLPATTDTRENELATTGHMKLKSTIIKRWADVDSDDSD